MNKRKLKSGLMTVACSAVLAIGAFSTALASPVGDLKQVNTDNFMFMQKLDADTLAAFKHEAPASAYHESDVAKDNLYSSVTPADIDLAYGTHMGTAIPALSVPLDEFYSAFDPTGVISDIPGGSVSDLLKPVITAHTKAFLPGWSNGDVYIGVS